MQPDARLVAATPSVLEEDANGWLVTFSDLVLQLFAFVMVAAVLGARVVPDARRATPEVVAPLAVTVPEAPTAAAMPALPRLGEPDALSLARFDDVPRAAVPEHVAAPAPAIVMVEVPMPIEAPIAMAAAGPAEKAAPAPIGSLASELESFVGAAGLGEAVQVAVNGGGVMLSISDTIGFASGSAELLPDAAAVLEEVRGLVAARPDLVVEVAGHTDDRPVHRGAFGSNLELSLARAARVAHELAAGDEALTSRIFAAGYGAQRPVADNADGDGRARNRRVELRLAPAAVVEGDPPLVRVARNP